MRRKFFVITLVNGNAVKTELKKWWRSNVGPTSAISHSLYFSLLSDGWKSEVVGNEVILISPQAMNGETDDSQVLIEEEPNVGSQVPEPEVGEHDFNALAAVFAGFIDSYNRMKEQGILRNQKDITGQLGEWVASILFDAEIAANGINAYWDLEDAEGKKYQVKSHAKALTTSARWSKIEYAADAPIDFIIIVVFDPSYKLQELYKVPFEAALQLRTGRFILNWSQIIPFMEGNLAAVLEENDLRFILPR
jgi:hypothetical protein